MSFVLGQRMWRTAPLWLKRISLLLGFPALTIMLLAVAGALGQGALLGGYAVLCCVGFSNLVMYAMRNNAGRMNG